MTRVEEPSRKEILHLIHLYEKGELGPKKSSPYADREAEHKWEVLWDALHTVRYQKGYRLQDIMLVCDVALRKFMESPGKVLFVLEEGVVYCPELPELLKKTLEVGIVPLPWDVSLVNQLTSPHFFGNELDKVIKWAIAEYFQLPQLYDYKFLYRSEW